MIQQIRCTTTSFFPGELLSSSHRLQLGHMVVSCCQFPPLSTRLQRFYLLSLIYIQPLGLMLSQATMLGRAMLRWPVGFDLSSYQFFFFCIGSNISSPSQNGGGRFYFSDRLVIPCIVMLSLWDASKSLINGVLKSYNIRSKDFVIVLLPLCAVSSTPVLPSFCPTCIIYDL